MPKTYLWKSMRAGIKSAHGNIDWHINKWEKESKRLFLCQCGFHASEKIIDAMKYVPCEILAKVEVKGKWLISCDKQVWSEMRIVKTYIWTNSDSVALAVFAAREVLSIFEVAFPGDLRPRKAIEAAENWLKEKTINITSAADAANAYAAAARAAAYAAHADARAAIYTGDLNDKIQHWIEKRLKEKGKEGKKRKLNANAKDSECQL